MGFLEPTRDDLEALQSDYRVLYDVKFIASTNTVCADFYTYDAGPDNSLSGLYFIVSPTPEHQQALDMNKGKGLYEILHEWQDMDRQQMNPYYNVVKLPSPVTRENIFSVHNEMCRAVQDSAVVKNSFFEYGYPLPKLISRQTVYNFYHFNARRNDLSLSDRVREDYNESMQKIVAESYHMYEKDGFLVDSPEYRISKHEVDKDYFLKNSIPAIYDTVTGGFYEYIKEHLDEHPDFIYYKEKKPYFVEKDLSKKFKGMGFLNPWAQYEKTEHFNIGFPSSMKDDFYGMMIEYNCLGYKNQTPIKDFLKDHPNYVEVEVDTRDMWNMNSLCGSNKVPYAVNSGYLHPVTENNVQKHTILIPEENMGMFTAIEKRLIAERKAWLPCNSRQTTNAGMNRPQYVNPYIKDDVYEAAINVPKSPEAAARAEKRRQALEKRRQKREQGQTI